MSAKETQTGIPSQSRDESSAELARVTFTNDELLNLTSFEDAMRLVLEKTGDAVMAHDVIGNGFRMLDDKSKLVDVPLMILEWKFLDGTFGQFVNMLLMTKNNEKFIVSDGSGILPQLQEVTERTGRTAGLGVLHGFTKSEYEYCQICRTSRPEKDCADYTEHKVQKEVITASSFYLDLSA